MYKCTGYNLYCETKRKIERMKHPEKTQTEIMNHISDMWRSLDKNQKLMFRLKAKENEHSFFPSLSTPELNTFLH